jgi:hypothetical protein
MGFSADFRHLSLISPGGNYIESETVTWDDERSSEAAMGGAQHRDVRAIEHKRVMRGARPKPTILKIFVLYITVQEREGGGAVKVAVQYLMKSLSRNITWYQYLVAGTGTWYFLFCSVYRNHSISGVNIFLHKRISVTEPRFV